MAIKATAQKNVNLDESAHNFVATEIAAVRIKIEQENVDTVRLVTAQTGLRDSLVKVHSSMQKDALRRKDKERNRTRINIDRIRAKNSKKHHVNMICEAKIN